MEIKNELRATQLGRGSGENQDIRHVMDMDEVVMLTQRAYGQVKKRNQDESRILADIGELPATVSPKWKTRNVHSINVFVTRLSFVLLHA